MTITMTNLGRLALLAALALSMAACGGTKGKADAFGNFETDETSIASENGGMLVYLPKQEGDAVKKGELLAMTDTASLILQIGQLLAQKQSIAAQKLNAAAQQAVADQQIANLEREDRRFSAMLAEGAASAKQIDDLRGQIAVARKQKEAYNAQLQSIDQQVAAAQAQVAVLKDKLAKSRVLSPMDGTVLETYTRQGELSVPGKPLLSLANLNSLILRAYISGNQLAGVKIGQSVRVAVDNADSSNSYTGKVEWIASQAEFTPKIIQTKEERVKLVYALKVRVPNDGSLKIGMPAELFFDATQP